MSSSRLSDVQNDMMDVLEKVRESTTLKNHSARKRELDKLLRPVLTVRDPRKLGERLQEFAECIVILIARGDYETAEVAAGEGVAHSPAKSDERADLLDLFVEVLWRNGKAHPSAPGTTTPTEKRAREAIEARQNLVKGGGDRVKLAGSLRNYAIVLFEIDEKYYPDSRRILERARWILENECPGREGEESFREELARVLTYLGLVLDQLNIHQQAEKYLVRAKGLFEKMPDQKQLRGLGLIYNIQALYKHEIYDDVSARNLYNESINCRAKLDIKDPHKERQHPDLAGTFNNLGALEHERGNYVEARNCYDTAHEIRGRLRWKHPHFIDTQGNLKVLNEDEKKVPSPTVP